MEFYETNSSVIILKGRVALYCEKDSGHLHLEKYEKFLTEWSPRCLGVIDGIFGKIKYHHESDWKLILITDSQLVCTLPDGTAIRRISKIYLYSLSTSFVNPPEIKKCEIHSSNDENRPRDVNSNSENKPLIQMVQSHLKNAAENVLTKGKQTRDRDKYEKQIQIEILKLLQSEGEGYFYFATNGADITHTLQEKQDCTFEFGFDHTRAEEPLYFTQPSWRKAKKMFFWNEFSINDAVVTADKLLSMEGLPNYGEPMSKELSRVQQLELRAIISDAEHIITPIMQGYFDTTELSLNNSPEDDENANSSEQETDAFPFVENITAFIASRRSKFRAGTRYRRRGIDERGHVANHVETEQILFVKTDTSSHTLSFLQIRGSIPLYWSQSSTIKYKPPINLEKDDSENLKSFKLHSQSILQRFNKLIIINLIDTGAERQENPLADALQQNILLQNDPNVVYVGFDFHEFCRGVHFENVSILLKELTEIIREMKYCWIDNRGMICAQADVFRVNCVDCLDRTNLVQCVLSNVVIETQLRKLGFLSPDDTLPETFHRKIQNLWANNGDAISRQYSGTIAMKGDFTRTGERTMNGMMRDGVSSVNRYYLRFSDITRQAVIDLILGNEEMSELQLVRSGTEDELIIMRAKEENVKKIVKKCRNMCIGPNETCYSECLLTAYKENSRISRELNTVLLISNENLHIIYNISILPYENLEICTNAPQYICIPLERITTVEIGCEPSVFKAIHSCIRINYNPPFDSFDIPLRKDTTIGDQILRTFSPPPNDSRMQAEIVKKSFSPTFGSSTNIISSARYQLTFAQPDVRLFNNILVQVGREAESISALKVLAVHLSVAIQNKLNKVLDVMEKPSMVKLDRVKASPIPGEYIKEIDIPALFQDLEINPIVLRRMNIMEKISKSIKVIGPRPDSMTNKKRAIISMKKPDEEVDNFISFNNKRIDSTVQPQLSSWFVDSNGPIQNEDPKDRKVKKKINQMSLDLKTKLPSKMNNFMKMFKKNNDKRSPTETMDGFDLDIDDDLSVMDDGIESCQDALSLIDKKPGKQRLAKFIIDEEKLKKLESKLQKNGQPEKFIQKTIKHKRFSCNEADILSNLDPSLKKKSKVPDFGSFYNMDEIKINRRIGRISLQLSVSDVSGLKEKRLHQEEIEPADIRNSILQLSGSSSSIFEEDDSDEHSKQIDDQLIKINQSTVDSNQDLPSSKLFFENNVRLSEFNFENNQRLQMQLKMKQHTAKHNLDATRLKYCPNEEIKTKFILI